jgi:putative membrane protein insertion efficiency factor
MKDLLIALLRVYKWLVSPLVGPSCRYVPSCSEYAMEAMARYGALKGGAKTAWRLARCHPFARGGFDPVSNDDLAEKSSSSFRNAAAMPQRPGQGKTI